ncbi:hypothetical protein [Streptomyces sp. NPDC057695]|uniref:hypothetical protein n=1 Tax=unclassified Streptomyces TaxID=2593676 RepID=UPI0036268496
MRLLAATGITLVGIMLLGAAASAVEVPVPAFLGPMSFSLPMALLLPLIPVGLLLHGQGRGDTAGELVSVRSPAKWDAAAMLVLVAVAATVGLVAAKAYDVPMGIAMGRNFAGYLGLALLIRRLAGPAASTTLVCVFPFVCTSFGVAGWGRPRFWAWPLHDAGSTLAPAAAFVLLSAGLAVSARGVTGPRRAASRPA